MFSVPVTFMVDFGSNDAKTRQFIMHEFAANGAENLVLSCWLIDEIMRDYKLAKQLQQEMDAEGLRFADAHAPFGSVLDLNCPDPDFRPQMLLRQKLAIRIAASFGIRTITIHPGSDRFFPEIPLEKHWDLMRDGLDRVLPEAESCGVTVCIENSMSRAACPAAVVMLKNEYPTDTLGLCYDSGHANQLVMGRYHPEAKVRQFWKTVGVDEPEWDDHILEKMLPQAVNCHLHDNDGSEDSHRLPGDGNVNWNEVIPALKKAPRLQVIQCEVKMAANHYSVKQVCRKFAELGEIN